MEAEALGFRGSVKRCLIQAIDLAGGAVRTRLHDRAVRLHLTRDRLGYAREHGHGRLRLCTSTKTAGVSSATHCENNSNEN